jgi:hypothetical protein
MSVMSQKNHRQAAFLISAAKRVFLAFGFARFCLLGWPLPAGKQKC